MSRFIEAYDRRTGEKLPHRVPESWITSGLYDYLSAIPTVPPETEESPAEEVTPATDEADLRPAGKHAAVERF